MPQTDYPHDWYDIDIKLYSRLGAVNGRSEAGIAGED